jgi:hypothetical protein
MSANFDIDAVKTFFDPYPGFAGAEIPIPAAVKKVANELNGTSMSLREAIIRISSVTDGVVSMGDDWIALELCEPDGTKHWFRVIRFK